MLFGIPWCRVLTARLTSELLLCEAYTSIAALVGTNRTLARDTVVIGKALALTCFPIAKTLIRTLG